MSTFRMTHQQVMACLSQAEEALQGGQKSLNDIQDCATQMVGSSWQGGRAGQFGQQMQQHHEDLTAVYNRVAQLHEAARNHANTFASFDAEV
jgi:uncharacterized protein YukE